MVVGLNTDLHKMVVGLNTDLHEMEVVLTRIFTLRVVFTRIYTKWWLLKHGFTQCDDGILTRKNGGRSK